MTRAGLPAAPQRARGLFPITVRASAPRAAPRGAGAPLPLGSVSSRPDPRRGPRRRIRSLIPKRREEEQRGRGGQGGSAFGAAQPIPPAPKSWALAAAQTVVFCGFFWKKQKLANGNGWFGVQRGGVSSRFRCILCSRNIKEGRRGTGKLRAAVVGWHGEHLPPGIAARPQDYTSPS